MSKSNAMRKTVVATDVISTPAPVPTTSTEAPKAAGRVKHQATPEQQAKLDSLATTSDRIRYLASEKLTTSQIRDVLNIRYQHVRNVLITPVKNPGVRGRTASPSAQA